MSFEFGFSLSQHHRLEQRLSLKQTLRLRLEHAVITPRAICSVCRYALTESDIKIGWLDDRFDITTECPTCHARFIAELDIDEPNGNALVHFLCPQQLFHRVNQILKGRQRVGIGFLQTHPELFWNWIRHFGTYDLGRKAFVEWRASL
ncbi:hypothetical protein A2318_02475 [Candidatus Uhrbacteria bacterium RIFOXYB2_FULL_45_11]|uniref:Uncharacterized protein n=1 Tax=Candidatus Uhrbacteria bacterium RIFOXYB2_FULL_45_11 TaxID=1802421 RepID=A0A1F7W535_9BACT|nr:MAG: hypothetical protein A2318_02475 [Candidatus Uhrbacteria bacterium RIFOXYB2_FULL_45_11]